MTELVTLLPCPHECKYVFAVRVCSERVFRQWHHIGWKGRASALLFLLQVRLGVAERAVGGKDPKRCGYVNRKHGWTWGAESVLLGLFWIIPVGCVVMWIGSSLGNVWYLPIYLESDIWRFYWVCLCECWLRASHELTGILKWKSWWLLHRAHVAVKSMVTNSPSYLWSYVQPVLEWVKPESPYI